MTKQELKKQADELKALILRLSEKAKAIASKMRDNTNDKDWMEDCADHLMDATFSLECITEDSKDMEDFKDV